MRQILILLLLPIASLAQTSIGAIFPLKDGKVHYEKTFDINNTSTDILKTRAKTWIAKQAWTQSNTQEVTNNDFTLITTNADQTLVFMIPSYGKNQVKSQLNYLYFLQLSLKDNKAKVVVDNLRLSGPTPNSYIPVEEYQSSIQSMYKGINNRQLNKYHKAVDQNYSELHGIITQKIEDLQRALSTDSGF